MTPLFVNWDVPNELVHLWGSFGIRWYSLLFIGGFILGYFIFRWFFRREKVSEALLDPLLYTLLIATIVGARLGHCIFYEPEDYFTSWEGFLEIFQPWKGGLASHGGAIALVIAMIWFGRHYGKKHGFDFWWIMDRLVITVCFAGALIRLGNLFNSEIYGRVTDLPWGFYFPQDLTRFGGELVQQDVPVYGQMMPHHPTQLYEALGYILLGLALLRLYVKKLPQLKRGTIFGIFLIGLFGIRFLVEFVKNDQVDFEAGMLLNMGQLLSIPFILAGFVILLWSRKKAKPAAAGRTALSLIAALVLGTAAAPKAQAQDTLVLTLEDALKIALSENISVKIADQEITRSEYAQKGTYAALFPQISLSGSYQRTIKKQVMYMDGMSGSGGMFGSMFAPIFSVLGQMAYATGVPFDADEIMAAMGGGDDGGSSSSGGIEVGRLNTYSAGLTASMPLINFQLWESIRISGQQVDLAVEQARESRLSMVTNVKQAYYGALLAKEAFDVYKSVYENAVENFEQIERRYNAQKASELEFTRAQANVASAIPNVYTAESNVILALWQLKALIGIDLDRDIDVAGELSDYAESMLMDINEAADPELSLEGNASLRQLALQAEMLANSVRTQQYAYLPTLSLAFSYSYMAMTNDFKFSEYKWTPYSYVGLQLNIPIFTGGKTHSAVRQAKIQQEELDLQKVNAERQLRIGIRQSLQTMEANMKSYASAETAVSLAEKAYDIAQQSYQVGRSTLTDLNDAQLTLTQARLGVSQAIYNYLNAKSSLEQMLGQDFLDE